MSPLALARSVVIPFFQPHARDVSVRFSAMRPGNCRSRLARIAAVCVSVFVIALSSFCLLVFNKAIRYICPMRVSQLEAARQVGCNPRTLRRWVKLSDISTDDRGRVSVVEVRKYAGRRKGAGRPLAGRGDSLPLALPVYLVRGVSTAAEVLALHLEAIALRKTRLEEAIEQKNRNALFWMHQGAITSTIGIRGCRCLLQDVVALPECIWDAVRPPFEPMIRSLEIRILAHVIDILFFSRKELPLDEPIGKHEYHSGDTAYAANVFRDARQYAAFRPLFLMPTEKRLEKVLCQRTTREIRVFTARLILEALHSQWPDAKYCRLPMTKADWEELEELIARKKTTGKRVRDTKHFRRCLGEYPTRNARRGFTLYWLLNVSSGVAAHWRKRTQRSYSEIKRDLQSSGLIILSSSQKTRRPRRNTIKDTFHEYANAEKDLVNNSEKPAIEQEDEQKARKPISEQAEKVFQRNLQNIRDAIEEVADEKARNDFIQNLEPEVRLALQRSKEKAAAQTEVRLGLNGIARRK